MNQYRQLREPGGVLLRRMSSSASRARSSSKYLPLLAGDSPDARKESILGRPLDRGEREGGESDGDRSRNRSLERFTRRGRGGATAAIILERRATTEERGKTEEREDGRRKAIEAKTELEVDDRGIAVVLNVPLEFVREVARASAVAEAAHVEGGPVARHGCCRVDSKRVRGCGWR